MRGLGKYRSLLSTPGALGFVVPGFVGRLPISMVGLGAVLMVSALYGSYALAGAVSAAVALSQAFVAPQVSRLADKHGQRRVLLPQLAAHAAGLVALVLTAQLGAPTWTLFAAAVLTGASFPQLGAMVRARWTNLLKGDPRLETAYAFESVADEAIFILGPVLVTFLATGVAPAAGLLVALVLVVAGSLALAARRDTEPEPAGRLGEEGALGASAIRSGGLRVLVLVFVGVGAIFGAVDVAMVAFAREEGAPAAAGVLIGLFATGSLLAGVAYGAKDWRTPPQRRFLVAVAVLALGTVPVTLSASIPLMALTVTLAGVAIAPTLITGYALVRTQVPPSVLTEGFTWLNIALFFGLAVGSPVAGAVVDAAGAQRSLLVAVAAGALAVVLAALGLRLLRPRFPEGSTPGEAEASVAPGEEGGR